jgi:hypothetical protein
MATNLPDNQVSLLDTFYAGSELLQFGVVEMPPNTKIYVYCNGVDITAFCAPKGVSGAKIGDNIVTNQLGTAAGWVYIPSTDGKYKFLVGEIVLTFSDSPNGVENSKYISETTLYNHGLNTVDTENGGTVALRATEKIRTSPLGNTLEVNTTQLRLDPLAQTFFVDPVTYPNGLYLTGVSLFIYEKDPTYPIAVELRQVINGTPSKTEVLSGSFALIQSADVPVFDPVSGKVPITNFTFPNIQYLKPGEWAFCVLTKSARYTLLSARNTPPPTPAGTTAADLFNNFANFNNATFGAGNLFSAATNADIAATQASLYTTIKNPFSGRLFRAQNTGEWVGDTNEDLAFILRKAKFATGSVTIEATSLQPSNTVEYDRLRLLSTAIDLGDVASVKYSVQTTAAGSEDKSEFQEIQPGNNLALTGRQALRKTGDLKLLIELTSKTKDVSPMLDRQLLAAQIFRDYITDYTTSISQSELKPSGGLAKARYISKPVSLADGFDSTGLEVKVAVNRQPGTDIEVFCRVLARNDKSVSNGIYDRPWTLMPLLSPAQKSFAGTDQTAFTIETYRILEPDLGYSVSTTDGGKYEDFAYYQVKVVFYSNNSVYQARIASLSAVSVI